MNSNELQQAVKAIYPSAAYPLAYSMTVDGSGNASIALWSNAVGVQPTTDQLTAALTSSQVAQARAIQTARVQAAYTTARYGTPVSITSGGNTLTFPTDPLTQTNVMGYLVAFNLTGSPAVPEGGLPLQDASGNVQMLAVADLQSLAGEIALQSLTAWQTLAGLQTQINAAASVVAVQGINWPA